MMKCPLCGDNDAISKKYDGKRQEIVVEHKDGTECKRQPCDENGNWK